MGISHGPTPPVAFQKAMIFIDGTNLFYRLEGARLKVPNLLNLFNPNVVVGRRQIVRVYLYTIEHHYAKAKRHMARDFVKASASSSEQVFPPKMET
jgi:hypothetical protein